MWNIVITIVLFVQDTGISKQFFYLIRMFSSIPCEHFEYSRRVLFKYRNGLLRNGWHVLLQEKERTFRSEFERWSNRLIQLHETIDTQ